MGAMECDRAGCKSIMCRRLICNGRYYICDECFEQLVKESATWTDAGTVPDNVDQFMTSDKRRHVVRGETAQEVFERYIA